MIKIVRADEAIQVSNINILIYGNPGAGKTSLAYSSSSPLLLDFDIGAHRALGRKDTVQIQKWEDIENLTASDLKEYDTIIIDTAGRALEVLIQYLIAKDPRLAKRTGELQLQGYGALASTFKSWLNKLRSYQKDIILIAHDKEEKDGERTILRFDAAGKSRDLLCQVTDLIGYLATNERNERVLDFNPTMQKIGKDAVGIGLCIIPNFSEQQDFMKELIKNAKSKLNEKSALQVKAEAEFTNLVFLIDSAIDAHECNILLLNEKLLAREILKVRLHNKAIALNLEYDKESKSYQQKKEEKVLEDVAL